MCIVLSVDISHCYEYLQSAMFCWSRYTAVCSFDCSNKTICKPLEPPACISRVLSITCVCVCVCAQSLSHVQLSVTLWIITRQATLSMGFFSQEYCSELLFPSSGDLSDPGIKLASPISPALQADSFPAEQSRKPYLLPH